MRAKPLSMTMSNFSPGTMLTCMTCLSLGWQFSTSPNLCLKASISLKKTDQDSAWLLHCTSPNWMFTILLRKWTPIARSQPTLCQYYLFSTWLTCNLNSLNSNDNRLPCVGSQCIMGQGETDSLFVLCQWSLESGLIRGAKTYTTPNQLQPGQLNLSQTY